MAVSSAVSTPTTHSVVWPVSVRLAEDLVLAEEARQAGHAGNRDGADQERPVGDRQILLQAAHLPEVLLAVQRVNHRAAAEEEQRLEERVRVEMEDAGANAPTPIARNM